MRLEYSLGFGDLFFLSAGRLFRSLPFSLGQLLISALFATLACNQTLWLFFIIWILLYCVTLTLAAGALTLVLFSKKPLLQSRSLRIEQRGLIESSGALETLLAWKDVTKTRAGLRTLTICYGARGRVLTVPARAFRTRQELAFFYHTVMQNAHAARA